MGQTIYYIAVAASRLGIEFFTDEAEQRESRAETVIRWKEDKVSSFFCGEIEIPADEETLHWTLEELHGDMNVTLSFDESEQRDLLAACEKDAHREISRLNHGEIAVADLFPSTASAKA